MRNTFKVLFYIKKNAPLRNGNTPIMGRITINGQRTQLSTQLSVNPNLWDASTNNIPSLIWHQKNRLIFPTNSLIYGHIREHSPQSMHYSKPHMIKSIRNY